MMSEVPEFFHLFESVLRCRDCGLIFVCRMSADNTLVKFVNDSGSEEAWLPTFEEGGYLDVVEQCVPEYSRNQKLTMQVFRTFEKKFRNFLHKPSTGGDWKVACGSCCPNCKSANAEIQSEQTLINPIITWITYDPIT